MPSHELLGPLQISLGRMMLDIVRFLVLFLLVSRNTTLQSCKNNQSKLFWCSIFDARKDYQSKVMFYFLAKVLLAFMVGMTNLYTYYANDRTSQNSNNKDESLEVIAAFEG